MNESSKKSLFPSFRPVPRTGVIFVMVEAQARGFYYGNPQWSNLGQGAPEAGEIPDAPKRIESMPIGEVAYEYGPVIGIDEMREAVANLYNHRYRRGMGSRYTAENVAISAGGRLGLTRIAAALNNIHLGHFLPDYTAYEELLDIFRAFVPIPILLRSEEGFRFEPEGLRREVMGKGLGALLMSNPSNPTGQLIRDQSLADWIQTARDLQCSLIMDEFYSHYLYDEAARRPSQSAAEFVEDVDRDPVVIIDGLTKNWRYPGLRLSWTVGPKDIIRRLGSAGSFIDGGANHALQKMAVHLLDPAFADQEARALQAHFSQKRRLMLDRLPKLGFDIKAAPLGAFYFFVSLDSMPEPIQNGMDFFRAGLEHQVITVPGIFFDVNPGQRRSHIPSRLRNYVRLSFGPVESELAQGLDRLETMIQSYR